MKSLDMIDIKKSEETTRIIKMRESTRKKVKEFLNEGRLQLSF